MDAKQKKRSIILFSLLIAFLLFGIFMLHSPVKTESVRDVMRDAVLHEENKISLFGIKEVNPGLVGAMAVTAILFVISLCIRLFVIPHFKRIPGKFQMLLEQAVGLFDSMAKSGSPHKNRFLGAYIFAAGTYIFVGTLFELLGLQAVTVQGHSVALPAPLSDINGAIMLGCLSYSVVLLGGLFGNGLRGMGQALKDFSLPISMSFRLFGALLSGALVTELVYYYTGLSFALPVIVGVLFTILHAVIQTYVLTMLTAIFYGEAAERTK